MTLQEILWEPLPDWREDAACNGVDAEVFFPVGEDIESMSRAKEVCAVCPVREDCLQYALATNQTEGVWGGTTSAERRRLRRKIMREIRKAS